ALLRGDRAASTRRGSAAAHRRRRLVRTDPARAPRRRRLRLRPGVLRSRSGRQRRRTGCRTQEPHKPSRPCADGAARKTAGIGVIAVFVTVWEYEVRLGMEAAFERLYGEHGAWVRLFREQPGYLRTDLLRGERHGHYLTL